ncbi:MOSC domain-containing protein [Actinoplanes sp. DH11]|uniref:MOSC domain-containing protein n=1 Tax=Actinoplanes sp. DH11 TaxID=2857011 RepID=UPI001E3C22B8|nr:transcription elongation factor [Actinoplanes sp. DH11]
MSAEQGTVAAVSRNDAYTFTKPNRDEIVLVAGLGVEGDIHAGVNVRHRSRVRADPAQPNLRQVHLIHAELFEEVAGKGYEVPAGGLGENVTTSGIDLLGLPRGTVLRFGRPAPGAGTGMGGAGTGSESGGGLEGGDAGPGLAAGHPVEAVLAAAASASLDGPTSRAADAVQREMAAVQRERAAAGPGAGAEVGDGRPAVVLAGLRNPCAQINGYRSGLLKEVLGQDERGNVVRKAGVMAVVLRGGPVRPGDPVTVELPPGPHGALERV